MNYHAVIVGAGIVGLATAFKLKKRFPDYKLAVIEKERSPALHQTGHNSGVIHSGIYYKPQSFKALLCQSGYHQMINYAQEKGIQYDICGKVIVAVEDSELRALNQIFERGLANGLQGLKLLTREETLAKEPHVNAKSGIWVPQTGIIGFRDVAESIRQDLERLGVDLFFGEEIQSLEFKKDAVQLNSPRKSWTTEFLINCGGLQSDRLAEIALKNQVVDFRIIPFRGEYYVLNKEAEKLVKGLIYPVPNPELPFLGVHLTRMIKGGVEAGPNAVLSLKRENYGRYGFSLKDTLDTLTWPGFYSVAKKYWNVGIEEVGRTLFKSQFTKAVQRILPKIRENDLEFHSAGVRAQAVQRDGKLVDDFLFISNQRVLNVCNAPSPAATSCFGIADHIIEEFLKCSSKTMN